MVTIKITKHFWRESEIKNVRKESERDFISIDEYQRFCVMGIFNFNYSEMPLVKVIKGLW